MAEPHLFGDLSPEKFHLAGGRGTIRLHQTVLKRSYALTATTMEIPLLHFTDNTTIMESRAIPMCGR